MINTTIHPYQRPLSDVVLWMIVTIGFYRLYWFYKNWAQIYPDNQVEVTPWFRTLMLIVPFVGLILIWTQFRSIRKFCKTKHVPTFEWPGLLVLIPFLITGTLLFLGMPSAFVWIASIFMDLCVMLRVQLTLNDYWGHAV
jgi:hypothetical protein